MRKYLFTGVSAFLGGALCFFAFLKFSPSSSQALLGESSKPHKPIVSALNLQPQPEEPPPVAQPSPQAQARPPIFDQDDADFFGGQDPFEAARRMHAQIQKQMRQGFAGFDVEVGGEEITAKEDDKSVSFELKGVEGSTLNTSVRNGYLTITGETKKEAAGMVMSSQFERSFPLPAGVDASKMETISEKDKVVLRFPKKHG
jgi:HSP20 family molecular chaperone IbpA